MRSRTGSIAAGAVGGTYEIPQGLLRALPLGASRGGESRSRCSSPSVPLASATHFERRRANDAAGGARARIFGAQRLLFAALMAVNRSSGAVNETSFCCNANARPDRTKARMPASEQPFDRRSEIGAEVIGSDVLEMVGFVRRGASRRGARSPRPSAPLEILVASDG
jgi:hypothetical protein